MANEEFQKIMADLRARQNRLNDDLAALEDESRAYARDHGELLLAVERDQGPTRPRQHPVAEALNTFHSTQVVFPSAVVPGAEAQPSVDENSLFVPEDAPIDEPAAVSPSRPERRVTFSDAPATIMGGLTPSENLEVGDINSTDEPAAVQSTPNDANMGYDQPVYTGKQRSFKHARHSLRTAPLMLCPGFTPVSSEDGPVNTPDQFVPVPATSDETNMSVDRPSYTGDRRPFRCAQHSSRTSRLMRDPGFTPTMPDSEPTPDPQDVVGTHDLDLFGAHDLEAFGAYPEAFPTYDPSISAGGPLDPFQGAENNNMSVDANIDVPNFVCPYPDCWKLYITANDMEEHLKHDHPDWALIKDTVVDPNSI